MVTVHRQENVDNPQNLKRIVRAFVSLNGVRLVYPLHPRTKRRLGEHGLLNILRRNPHVVLTKPLGYLDFLWLLGASSAVLTDSGGVQEEALTLGVPCVTLRYSTERPETLEAGGNVLVGTETSLIVKRTKELLEDGGSGFRVQQRNPLGDGKAGERIAQICTTMSDQQIAIKPARYLKDGSASYRLVQIHRPRKIGRILIKTPNIILSQVFDENGNPVVPEKGLKLQKGWCAEVFGQPSDLANFVSHIS